jgi:hypothetical protein
MVVMPTQTPRPNLTQCPTMVMQRQSPRPPPQPCRSEFSGLLISMASLPLQTIERTADEIWCNCALQGSPERSDGAEVECVYSITASQVYTLFTLRPHIWSFRYMSRLLTANIFSRRFGLFTSLNSGNGVADLIVHVHLICWICSEFAAV